MITRSKIQEYISNSPPFSLFSAFWLGLAFWSLLLAVSGFFHPFLLGLYFFPGVVFLLFQFWKKSLWNKTSLFLKVALGIFFLYLAVLSFWTQPSVFSGRDEGSYSQAAINLVKNRQAEFSFPAQEEFFKIYGPGRALNFPGFDYTGEGKLVTHFPLGYISWLASFYALFGVWGLVVSNIACFGIFFFSFFLLTRKILGDKWALGAVFLCLSTFPFFWFFRFTLSENLALALFWLGVFWFHSFWEKPEKKSLLFFLSALFLLTFSRLEAWSFIFLAVLAIVFSAKKRVFLKKEIDVRWSFLILPALIFYSLFVFQNRQYFLSVAKGFFSSLSSVGEDLERSGLLSEFFYTLSVFRLYSLSVFLIFGVLGAIFYLHRKRWGILLPLFLGLPFFYYFINPSISLDHPWMLRRFFPVAVPVLVLLTAGFVKDVFRKKIFSFVTASFLLAGNVFFLFLFAGKQYHPDLFPQIASLSRQFEKNDLILVDRLATGDNWAMMDGPMRDFFSLQAVYFFNPNDLPKIDTDRFSLVYLIIPDESLDLYRSSPVFSDFQKIRDYRIETGALSSPRPAKDRTLDENLSLPRFEKRVVNGSVYRYNTN